MARFRVLVPFVTPGPLGTLVAPGAVVDLPSETRHGGELELVEPDTPLGASPKGHVPAGSEVL